MKGNCYNDEKDDDGIKETLVKYRMRNVLCPDTFSRRGCLQDVGR